MVALACVCWGLDNNLTALVSGFTPAQTTAIKGIGAGTVNLVIGLVIEGGLPLGASRSQILFSSSPFLGVLLAWFMFGERATAIQFGAAGFMVGGIALMFTVRHEHQHTHEAMSHAHEHRHDDSHHTHVHLGLPARARHTHAHEHEPLTHSHPHAPDLHHRHEH